MNFLALPQPHEVLVMGRFSPNDHETENKQQWIQTIWLQTDPQLTSLPELDDLHEWNKCEWLLYAKESGILSTYQQCKDHSEWMDAQTRLRKKIGFLDLEILSNRFTAVSDLTGYQGWAQKDGMLYGRFDTWHADPVTAIYHDLCLIRQTDWPIEYLKVYLYPVATTEDTKELPRSWSISNQSAELKISNHDQPDQRARVSWSVSEARSILEYSSTLQQQLTIEKEWWMAWAKIIQSSWSK